MGWLHFRCAPHLWIRIEVLDDVVYQSTSLVRTIPVESSFWLFSCGCFNELEALPSPSTGKAYPRSRSLLGFEEQLQWKVAHRELVLLFSWKEQKEASRGEEDGSVRWDKYGNVFAESIVCSFLSFLLLKGRYTLSEGRRIDLLLLTLLLFPLH